MAGQTDAQARSILIFDSSVYREGIVGGILGAAGIALWFLIIDSIHGRPFFTPSVLGTAIFGLLQGGGSLAAPESVPVSLGMVIVFSCMHGAGFAAIGVLCSMLLQLAEQTPGAGLWVVLLLVCGAMWITFVNMLFAGVVLNALSIVDIMIAHALAAVAMTVYYKRRHPGLAHQA